MVKARIPHTQFSLWRSEHFYNLDIAAYTLSHHSFPRHFHDHYVIELVLKGTDRFYCDGKNYTASAGDLVLINPGEVHTGSTIDDTPLQYFSLCPDTKTWQQVAEALDVALQPDFIFEKTLAGRSSLTERLQLLYNSLVARTGTLHQQTLFFDCMTELLQQNDKKERSINNKDPRVAILVDFIHTHFRQDICLTRMAASVNLNPFHVARLFKKSTGLAPYEYLLVVRTEFAKQLLRKGHSVQAAAQESGFYDASHLNRLIRKMSATSPKSYLLSKSQYRTIIGC